MAVTVSSPAGSEPQLPAALRPQRPYCRMAEEGWKAAFQIAGLNDQVICDTQAPHCHRAGALVPAQRIPRPFTLLASA